MREGGTKEHVTKGMGKRQRREKKSVVVIKERKVVKSYRE
jgi:hypothetical protein